jgi:hypothetical protein
VLGFVRAPLGSCCTLTLDGDATVTAEFDPIFIP